MALKSSDFIRDPARVHAAVSRTQEGSFVAKRPLKVHIPARFPQRELAIFEDEITFVGYCAIIVDDKYFASSSICAPFRSEPSAVGKVIVDDVEYIEMEYEVGDRVIASENLVMIDNLPYRVYDEMIAKGRIPWYMDPVRGLGRIFESVPKHAGVNLEKTPTVVEMITSTICRDPDDLKRYYRQKMNSYDDIVKNPPVLIPLRNVSYGATNTVAKLLGSHFDEGMTSAIVSPGDRVERTEKILRT